ncbi:MAG TPA: VOC family protein [Terriglobales bacterium]|nr:VOC family protein [Terriglobales bacterium]
MITYKGLDHVALVTKKLEAMKKFYAEALGMKLEHEGKSKAGFTIVTLRAGASVVDLFEATPTNPAPAANLTETHFCLAASGSSIYDVIANLKRAGLEPTPAEVNDGAEGKGLSTFVRDPDGNRVEIKVY